MNSLELANEISKLLRKQSLTEAEEEQLRKMERQLQKLEPTLF